MNERIFELIQAQNGFRGLLWTEEDKQEFAELIVEECLDLVSYGGEFCSRPKLVEKIKQHFGVESV